MRITELLNNGSEPLGVILNTKELKIKIMAFKNELKKVITANTKYTAVKVWKPEVQTYCDDTQIMTIEITVRKKKK